MGLIIKIREKYFNKLKKNKNLEFTEICKFKNQLIVEYKKNLEYYEICLN